ncbi:MAG: ferrochelatase [Pirellulales bacterium]
MTSAYDAVLLVSFGGPEGPADVLPFLENVLRGKNVPRERMLAVAEHYRHFGGVSPLNAQNRALVSALDAELQARGPRLPVYWGNRNWHPLLADTLAQMTRDGVRRALGFFTSAYSSYSSCRQYREDIQRACATLGAAAPQVDKLRAYFNHPGFIGPMVERMREARSLVPEERRAQARVVFTAHSIPLAMSETSPYVAQLTEASRLVCESLGIVNQELAYQSRSGPPQQAWLEPDILDVLRRLHGEGRTRDVVVVPIGFLSDHIEILWDLDTEAQQLAQQLGLNLIRASTVGSHPDFVGMIRELIAERVSDAPRRSLGVLGPSHDACPADCCPPLLREPSSAS